MWGHYFGFFHGGLTDLWISRGFGDRALCTGKRFFGRVCCWRPFTRRPRARVDECLKSGLLFRIAPGAVNVNSLSSSSATSPIIWRALLLVVGGGMGDLS